MEMIDRALLTFLLNSLWQIPIVAGVAALACWFMRNGPARHRHAILVAALVAALLLPAASVRRSSGPAQTIEAPAPAIVSASAPAAERAPFSVQPNTPAPRVVPIPGGTALALLGAYVLFVAIQLARLAWRYKKTTEIRRAATPRTCPALERVSARCTTAFRLTGADMLFSDTISGPVTAGRAVILPDSIFRETRENLLTTAVGHEMAHIARHDFALNILYELLYVPISFHPAALWLRGEVDRTRELACDELVTTSLLEPAVYAESIVSIATTMSGVPQPGYTLGVFDGDILEERIRCLLDRPVANLKRARLLLAAGISALAVCAVIASGLAVSARAQSAAQPEMKLAQQAYNSGDFRGAMEHFQRAANLDAHNVNARLYLANALIREAVAEKKAGPASNNPLLLQAQHAYQEALALDPGNVTAMLGLASLNGPDQAQASRDLMLKAIQIDPKNKDAYYTAGVLDWQMAFRPIVDANQGIGPGMYTQIPAANLRARVRAQTLPQIEDGFRMLQIALELDPNSSSAAAYMNLLSRLKAAVVDDPSESSNLMAQADAWVRKALANRKSEAGRAKNSDSIDVDQPAPQAVPSAVPIPPPPPPPPPPGTTAANPHEAPPPPPPPPKG
jgi:beta-lactamase regulating signal transducer with metallopeptidase domain